MTIATLTGTDVRLRNFVIRELDWDPLVDASEIGVAAKEGIVTLTGFVETYVDKLAAERVAKRVPSLRCGHRCGRRRRLGRPLAADQE